MVVQTASLGSQLDPPSDSNASSGGEDASTGVLVAEAPVFDAQVPPANSSSSASQLVSIEVPSTSAAAVSTAAAAGQVSLVLLPSNPPGSGSGIKADRLPDQHGSSAVARKRS